jgi:putative acetyltransferase
VFLDPAAAAELDLPSLAKRPGWSVDVDDAPEPRRGPSGSGLSVSHVPHPLPEDVLALLARHVAYCEEHTPEPEFRHCLTTAEPDVAYFAARDGAGVVLGVGALRRVPEEGAPSRLPVVEVKSMHTTTASRGQGIARAVLDRLLQASVSWGASRVVLETGSGPAFEAARKLYQAAGFTPCGAYGGYPPGVQSVFMGLDL